MTKKDAMIFREEDEPSEILTSTNLSPNGLNGSSPMNASMESPTSKNNFERKNSFLGKLFSKRRSSNNNTTSCAPLSKPEMGTFSAQFPPPELIAHYNEIYTPIRKSNNSKANEAARQSPKQTQHDLTSPTAQVRNGPSGNFVVFERNGGAIYGTASPPTSTAQQNSSPLYGKISPQTQPPLYGVNPLRYQYPRSEAIMYSNPPPPLPYRPPPPNPYQRSPEVASKPTSHIGETPSSQNYAQKPYQQQQQQQQQQSQQVKRNGVKFSENTFYAISEAPISMSSTSSSSGPSSIDSQVQQVTRRRLPLSPKVVNKNQVNQSNNLYDETLVVIEKSNIELESNLSPKTRRTQITHPRVDTIHNNKNLVQEVIYEIEPSSSSTDISRSSSQSTIKPGSGQESVAQSYPSLSDLSLHEVSNNFKSLTAQKLMAGLSFNSIDTLLEVNAAAEARNQMNESTETVDFGVI